VHITLLCLELWTKQLVWLRVFRRFSRWARGYLPELKLRAEVVVDENRAVVGAGVVHPDVEEESECVEARDDVEDATEDIVD
jgi:hypothetical protein